VSAAIDGLCAAVVRNSEVTLSAKGTSVCGGPGGEETGPSCRVARAGEHGPPWSTEPAGGPFNACDGNVTARRSRNRRAGARGSGAEGVDRRRAVGLAGTQHGGRERRL